MSARRMLIISLFVSLLGHLIIFVTFSATIPEEREMPPGLIRLSFLGELVERRIFPRVETVIREGEPQLQPLFREMEAGPGPSLVRPSFPVPAPQISVEGILSLPHRDETSLLQMRVAEDRKEVPPKRPHLLEREQDE